MPLQGATHDWNLIPSGIRARVVLGVFLCLPVMLRAQTTWSVAPGTSLWNTAGNWSNGVPTSAKAALFGTSSTSNLTFSAAAVANGLTFNTGGPAYAFANNGYSLTIDGGGITNNSANTETFSASVTVAAAQTWNDTGTGGLTFGAVTLSNTLTLAGASSISVTGALTNSGGNRTITNSTTGAVTFANINLSNNNTAHTLRISGTGATTVGGVIANGGTGAGALTKTGAGTLVLSGANTYSGATTVSAGTVNIQNDTALGTTSGTTSVASGATLQVQGGLAVAEALSLRGTGTATNGALENVSGANTLTGAITLAAATRINSDAGTLTISGNIGGNTQKLTVGGAGNTTISGVIGTTSGTLTKDGAGTLVLSGANTFTGGTTVSAGTLALGANNTLSSTGAVSVASGATLTLNNYAQTVGALSGAGTVQLGSGTLIAGNGGASSTFSGSFASGDTGAFEKTGAGTLTFGSNLSLSNGTLALAGGKLSLGGYTSTFGTLSVTASSTIDFTGGSVLNVNSVTIAGGVTLTIQNWVNGVDYFYSVNNPGATILGQIAFTGYSPSATKWQSFDQEITPVPEPASYGAVFMFLGLCGVAWRRLRSGSSLACRAAEQVSCSVTGR
jgi:autotransporter-associated beta strand protein